MATDTVFYGEHTHYQWRSERARVAWYRRWYPKTHRERINRLRADRIRRRSAGGSAS